MMASEAFYEPLLSLGVFHIGSGTGSCLFSRTNALEHLNQIEGPGLSCITHGLQSIPGVLGVVAGNNFHQAEMAKDGSCRSLYVHAILGQMLSQLPPCSLGPSHEP